MDTFPSQVMTDNPKLTQFVNWLGTPPEDRLPKTQRELAEQLGVHEAQLSIWKKELSLQSAPPSEVVALRNHIIAEAKTSGNAQMARLAWDIMNPDKKEVRGFQLNAEDYFRIEREAEERIRGASEQNYRVAVLSERPEILSNQLRSDSNENQAPQNN